MLLSNGVTLRFGKEFFLKMLQLNSQKEIAMV